MRLVIGQNLDSDGEPQDCVNQVPSQLRILTGVGQFQRIVLTADPSNPRVITVTFHEDAGGLFDPPPPTVVNFAPRPSDPQFAALKPHPVSQLILHIRQNLGLKHRGTFEDEDDRFARALRFDTDPERCGDGDHPDVIVER